MAPGQLLGGNPLGSATLQWRTAEPHPQPPTGLWGDVRAPLPTNTWWQNLVLDDGGTVGENVIYPMPLLVRTLPDGLHACAPTAHDQVGSVDVVTLPFVDSVSFGAYEHPIGRTIVDHDPLSVTVRWSMGHGHFDAPLVRGSPYATVLYTRATPVLKFPSGGIARVDGSAPSEDGSTHVSGHRFAVTLGNGQSWTLYAAPPLSLRITGGSIAAAAEYTGAIRVARVVAGGALLDAHAGRIPLGGAVHAAARDGVGTLRFEWRSSGPGELLLMALPHQLDVLAPATKRANLTLSSMKGGMGGVLGDEWSMAEPLPQLGWGAPRRVAAHRLAAVRDAVRADASKPVEAVDPYGGGKELAALGRLVLIADELGEAATASAVRQRLGGLLAAWLQGEGANPLRHERTWGGVVSSNGLADRNADFGNGWFNDHHFHYGYFIYAAAAVGKGNASWLRQWDGAVRHLLRDIANPSDADALYPRSRHKDWYDGHGWANGLFPSASSRNQESVSEAANAWYAIALYGVATADARVRDLGRLMLATELRAAWRYWQISDESVYPPVFAANGVVGCLWSTKVDRSTWFGSQPAYTFGIQIMPLTPATELLLRPAWVAAARPAWSQALGGATDEWRAFLIAALAVFDPDAAWRDATSLTRYDNGNSRANMLYWIGTREPAAQEHAVLQGPAHAAAASPARPTRDSARVVLNTVLGVFAILALLAVVLVPSAPHQKTSGPRATAGWGPLSSLALRFLGRPREPMPTEHEHPYRQL